MCGMINMDLVELKKLGEAPDWYTEDGFKTVIGGYLLEGETPKGMYQRVARAAASYQSNPEYWYNEFFKVIWNNWLCPASPVLSNFGSNRGLPISCNSVHIPDTTSGIFDKAKELAMLSKYGAGVGIYLGDIRGRGSKITGGGFSEGVVPWAKLYDTTVSVVSQGAQRRGAAALFLPIDHPDIEEFINIRRPIGDLNRRCLNINHGVCITDDWMKSLINGDKDKRRIWESILSARIELGEPYLFFTDNVNKVNPECYVKNNLSVKTTNICSEIFLHTDPEHSFVCCLSSLNLVKYYEWKDTDLIETSIRFLDAVLQEYIEKSKDIPGLECARNSAIKGRALGLGVLGWHTLLQSKMIPFESFDAMRLNNEIFKLIKEKSDIATKQLANELGEPEWCKGFGVRNTHCISVAPTVSNSTISGGHSASIEPIAANIYSFKSAKGTFIKKNPILEKLLESKGINTIDTWKSIISNQGSVQHLKDLTEEEKSVFLTAREINQFAIINQAAQRQKYIDQGQSVNLFFASNADPKYIHKVHLAAWEQGLKSLYYCRSEGVLRGDLASRSSDECLSCHG